MFKQLKNNGVLMAGANQEALDPVVTGAKSMVIASVDYMTYQAKAKGEPVDLIYPAEGTVISARPALILKTSNNADNAQAFMDYLLSDEVQKMVADAYLLPGRSDVKVQGRPSASEIPTLKVNSDWMIANEKGVIQQFTDIFKK
ncbi:Extracellular solute-binding protein family 1 (fragment) [Candidatus Desulfosporosinus infrequens]|uniref:Extracellular solute-binding protein family 1 n=1 Tax=Candidatus Desulfosporosinus infrequens TaxID=2043169 RepID=A0A2U3LKV4_9FIRM